MNKFKEPLTEWESNFLAEYMFVVIRNCEYTMMMGFAYESDKEECIDDLNVYRALLEKLCGKNDK